MVVLSCLFLLIVGFQAISADGPPKPPHGPHHKCAGPPPGIKDPQSCCPMTPLFTEDEMKECGFEKIDPENHPHGPPDCSKQECLLKKRNLMDDDKINYDKAKAFVKSWVEENPEFEEVAGNAMEQCMGENGPPGPPHVCEAFRLTMCVGGFVYTNCPVWQDTDDCKKVKDHIDECKAHFHPPN